MKDKAFTDGDAILNQLQKPQILDRSKFRFFVLATFSIWDKYSGFVRVRNGQLLERFLFNCMDHRKENKFYLFLHMFR